MSSIFGHFSWILMLNISSVPFFVCFYSSPSSILSLFPFSTITSFSWILLLWILLFACHLFLLISLWPFYFFCHFTWLCFLSNPFFKMLFDFILHCVYCTLFLCLKYSFLFPFFYLVSLINTFSFLLIFSQFLVLLSKFLVQGIFF